MKHFEVEEMYEMISSAMAECDNDVHIAIEIVSKDEGIATEDLYNAYDEVQCNPQAYPGVTV